jgi:hypothetical protein
LCRVQWPWKKYYYMEFNSISISHKIRHSEISWAHCFFLQWHKLLFTVGKGSRLVQYPVHLLYSFNQIITPSCEVFSLFNSDVYVAIALCIKDVSFFLGGKKCQKIVNIGVMRKDRARRPAGWINCIWTTYLGFYHNCSTLKQPLNAYGYKYFSLLLLLFYPFVVPADLSQRAKSATADGLTYSDSTDKKVRTI